MARRRSRVRIPYPPPFLGSIAQLAEHRTFNPQVPGSSPGGPTILFERTKNDFTIIDGL